MKKYKGDNRYIHESMTEEQNTEYKQIIFNEILSFPEYKHRKLLIWCINDRLKGLNNCNDDPYMIDACQCYIDILNEYYPNNTITGRTKTGEAYQLNNHERWILHCEESHNMHYQYTTYSIKIDYTGSTRELNGVLNNNFVVTVKGDLQYI